jgi:hypothetical protein
VVITFRQSLLPIYYWSHNLPIRRHAGTCSEGKAEDTPRVCPPTIESVRPESSTEKKFYYISQKKKKKKKKKKIEITDF